MTPPPLRAAVTMLAACVCFTVMSLAVGAAHRGEPGLSSIASSAVRSAVNLAIILVVARGSVARLLGDRRPALWLRGVAGAIALLTYFAALPRIGVGEAAFLNNTSAFWVAALSPWLLGERARASIWLAVTASLIGLALLGWPREGHQDGVGRLLGAVSGLSASFAYLSVRRASGSNAPETIVFYFIALSSLLCIVIAATTTVVWPHQQSTWAWLVVAGVAATGGQYTMTRAYQLGEAAPLAALATASPLLSALSGVGLLGERPDGLAWLGMGILAVAGVGLPLWDAGLGRGREPSR